MFQCCTCSTVAPPCVVYGLHKLTPIPPPMLGLWKSKNQTDQLPYQTSANSCILFLNHVHRYCAPNHCHDFDVVLCDMFTPTYPHLPKINALRRVNAGLSFEASLFHFCVFGLWIVFPFRYIIFILHQSYICHYFHDQFLSCLISPSRYIFFIQLLSWIKDCTGWQFCVRYIDHTKFMDKLHHISLKGISHSLSSNRFFFHRNRPTIIYIFPLFITFKPDEKRWSCKGLNNLINSAFGKNTEIGFEWLWMKNHLFQLRIIHCIGLRWDAWWNYEKSVSVSQKLSPCDARWAFFKVLLMMMLIFSPETI